MARDRRTVMNTAELLADGFGRVRETALAAIEGLSVEGLGRRVEERSNSIAWLVWHLTRIQDDHVADAAGIEQVWTAKGWAERFGLPFDTSATGFGQSSDEVAAVRVDAERLIPRDNHLACGIPPGRRLFEVGSECCGAAGMAGHRLGGRP